MRNYEQHFPGRPLVLAAVLKEFTRLNWKMSLEQRPAF